MEKDKLVICLLSMLMACMLIQKQIMVYFIINIDISPTIFYELS